MGKSSRIEVTKMMATGLPPSSDQQDVGQKPSSGTGCAVERSTAAARRLGCWPRLAPRLPESGVQSERLKVAACEASLEEILGGKLGRTEWMTRRTAATDGSLPRRASRPSDARPVQRPPAPAAVLASCAACKESGHLWQEWLEHEDPGTSVALPTQSTESPVLIDAAVAPLVTRRSTSPLEEESREEASGQAPRVLVDPRS